MQKKQTGNKNCICKARRKSLSDTEMPQAKANFLEYFLSIECFSRNKHKH